MARPTLQSQLEHQRVREATALSRAREKQYLQYVNANLAITKDRRPGWTQPADAERDFSTQDRRKAMAQARQLVEETALGIGILRAHLDYVCGAELQLSMRTTDSAWNDAVERRWDARKNFLDIRNVRSWGRLCRMWQGRKAIDGDVGIFFWEGTAPDGSPLSHVQTIEADRIFKTEPGRHDDYGIDFDAYGMPLTYYVGKRDHKPNIDKTTPYDARYFALFQAVPNERAETPRGASMMLQLLNVLKDLDETDNAMAQKVKNEAFMGLFFGMDPTPGGIPFDSDSVVSKTDQVGVSRAHVQMVPGLNINGNPGEEVSVIESKSPHGDYMPYMKYRMRIAGLPLGLPLEFLLMDSTEVNYSGLMVLAQMLRRSLKVQQADLRMLCSRIFQWWLAREIKGGIFGAPPASIKGAEWSHTWGCPSAGFIDPEKELNAYEKLVAMRVYSRQDVLDELGDGRDFEDISIQIQREKEIETTRGTVPEPKAATAPEAAVK